MHSDAAASRGGGWRGCGARRTWLVREGERCVVDEHGGGNVAADHCEVLRIRRVDGAAVLSVEPPREELACSGGCGVGDVGSRDGAACAKRPPLGSSRSSIASAYAWTDAVKMTTSHAPETSRWLKKKSRKGRRRTTVYAAGERECEREVAAGHRHRRGVHGLVEVKDQTRPLPPVATGRGWRRRHGRRRAARPGAAGAAAEGGGGGGPTVDAARPFAWRAAAAREPWRRARRRERAKRRTRRRVGKGAELAAGEHEAAPVGARQRGGAEVGRAEVREHQHLHLER